MLAMLYFFPSSVEGDRYITPWTAACMENWSKVLEEHGDQLDTVRYGK